MKGNRFYGAAGENFASKFLKAKGYEIVQKNFSSRYGEIDLIAKRGETFIFVEVKIRWSKKFGTAAEAVNASKLEKIKKTIDYYFFINKLKNKKARIEVVAIDIVNGKVSSVKNIVVD